MQIWHKIVNFYRAQGVTDFSFVTKKKIILATFSFHLHLQRRTGWLHLTGSKVRS